MLVDTQSASGIDTIETESVETEVMSKASKGETLASELSESLSKSVSGSSLDSRCFFFEVLMFLLCVCGCDNVYFVHSFLVFFATPNKWGPKDPRHLDQFL